MTTVPDSVMAYFSQPSVTAAANLMLSAKRDWVPDALAWNEVQTYYAAVLAARQTQVEFAMWLASVWETVWQDGPTGWTPCPAASQGRRDLSIGVETVWAEGCFTRRFEQRRKAVELSVGLWSAETGVQLGVIAFDGNGDTCLGSSLSKAGLVLAPEYGTYWSPEAAVTISPEIDLAPLLGWRDDVLAIVTSKR